MPVPDPRLLPIVQAHPYPLVFATLSGSHLYGFSSPDSDFDVRGVHVLPLEEVLGLKLGRETVEQATLRDGLDLDLVTHDLLKFCKLLLKKSGYVLEQVCSPWVIAASPDHEELRALALDCVTKQHVYHYLGFAATQQRLLEKEDPPRIKPLLYLYRVYMTGIHLLRTGQVEAHLPTLNADFALPLIDDLIARKRAGAEDEPLRPAEVAQHQAQLERLDEELTSWHQRTALPNDPRGRDALHDFLLRVRMRELHERSRERGT